MPDSFNLSIIAKKIISEKLKQYAARVTLLNRCEFVLPILLVVSLVS